MSNLGVEEMEARAGIEPPNKGFADLDASSVSVPESADPAASAKSEPKTIQRRELLTVTFKAKPILVRDQYRAVVYTGKVVTDDHGTMTRKADEQFFSSSQDEAWKWLRARVEATGSGGALLRERTEEVAHAAMADVEVPE